MLLVLQKYLIRLPLCAQTPNGRPSLCRSLLLHLVNIVNAPLVGPAGQRPGERFIETNGRFYIHYTRIAGETIVVDGPYEQ